MMQTDVHTGCFDLNQFIHPSGINLKPWALPFPCKNEEEKKTV